MLNLRVKKRIIFTSFLLITISLFFFSNNLFFVQAITAIAALSLFYLTDYLFDVQFELKHYLFAAAIVFSGLIFSPLYFVYANYDKILHFVLPILYSSIAFRTLRKFDLDLRWKLLFVFFISIGTLALFEMGEFTLDFFFNVKTQGVFIRDPEGLTRLVEVMDRNTDTMLDLIDGTLGSLTYVIASGVNWFSSKKKVR